jgi:hypothetical protein
MIGAGRGRRRGRAPASLPTTAASRRSEHSISCWLVNCTASYLSLSVLLKLDLNSILLFFFSFILFKKVEGVDTSNFLIVDAQNSGIVTARYMP